MNYHFDPKKHLPLVLIALAALVGLRYALPYFLPVLLGLLMALFLSPLVKWLQEKTGLSRSGATLTALSGLFLILLGSLFLAGRFLIREAGKITALLPELISSVSGVLTAFAEKLSSLSSPLPRGISEAVTSWTDGLLASGGALTTGLSERLFSAVSGFLGRLPDHLLFFITFLLAVFFATTELPRIKELLHLHLPEELLRPCRRFLSSGKLVLTGWFRAQIRLMGVTFLILFAGFLILRTGYALALALGIALMDALPLLGTGIVLLPWGLISMISGDLYLGMGLIILYGVAALVRNILEPKFLGDSVGISPLLSLLSIYAGYRFSGFWGMILLPIGVMIGAELYSTGKHHSIEP